MIFNVLSIPGIGRPPLDSNSVSLNDIIITHGFPLRNKRIGRKFTQRTPASGSCSRNGQWDKIGCGGRLETRPVPGWRFSIESSRNRDEARVGFYLFWLRGGRSYGGKLAFSLLASVHRMRGREEEDAPIRIWDSLAGKEEKARINYYT